ncbi:type II inositol 3,4-bisphosphate 4-phosphatase isoform X2 [Pectinophora gossypiella]|uniref:type II inositol 3,4-bisphosphate 4-phosphatase isoform X2 n=1 Tax=Pectinophora gossypiella TaxID=13191 RepID=UPI00214ECF4F|nr:type II inositol 3,4-bisphosphate 4-phosphatase isoform X2 [Pectinophora gossypiella]
MRYNKQELVALASQSSQNFDREGVMVMKERQDGFFRRSEGCSVRWFRLRGNLLFYLKGPEPWDEPMGVIVLGNHKVKVQNQDENGHWPFHIDMNEVPLCELAISCDNLLCDDLGYPPSPVVVVTVKTSNGAHIIYGKTENIEASSNPCFSKTILFRPSDELAGEDHVKLTVYDVKEPVTDTMVYMGSTILLLRTIQEALRLRVPLTGEGGRTVGFITMNTWSLEPSYVGASPSREVDAQKIYSHRRSQSLPPRLGLKLMYPSYGCLFTQNFVNPYQSTYRFHSGLGGDINVHEIMAEVKICYQMPIQLLDIFILREREHLEELLSVGEVCVPWQARQIQLVGIHVSLMKHYAHCKTRMEHIDTPYMKPSSKKNVSSLEFAPTNLHLQRMWVHNDTINKTGFHDVVTAGAFTAHTHTTEQNGGLLRLVQLMKEGNSARMPILYASANKIHSDYENVTAMRHFRDELVNDMNTVTVLAAEKKRDQLPNCIDEIKNKLNNFINLYDPSTIEEALCTIKFPECKNRETMSTLQLYTERLSIYDATTKVSNDSLTASPAPPSASHTSTPSEGFVPVATCSSEPCVRPRTMVLEDRQFGQPSRSRTLPDSYTFAEASASNSTLHLDRSATSLENATFMAMMDSTTRNKAEGYDYRGEPAKAPELDVEIRKLNLAYLKNVATTTEEALNAYYAAVRKCFDSTVEDIKNNFDEMEDCIRAAKIAMESVIRWTRVAHAMLRLRCEPQLFTFEHASLQIRRDACFSQALTTVSAGLVCWFNSMPPDIVVKVLSTGAGPLCGFEGLLSLYASEDSMWGDMSVAVEDLHSVVFVLTKAAHNNTTPRVTGARGAITVYIPVSEVLFSHFGARQQYTFCVTAVFFNIGINEKADLAEAAGATGPQYRSNCDNVKRLCKYYRQYRRTFPGQLIDVRGGRSLEEVIETLKAVVHRRIEKNVEVLHLAALATRLMKGLRFTSCKSAKDRTGMSVTLEQTTILSSDYHLAEHEKQKALDIMRSDGCRRENTEKNINVRKYAFSRRQVLALPEEYRPPAGSYGVTHT